MRSKRLGLLIDWRSDTGVFRRHQISPEKNKPSKFCRFLSWCLIPIGIQSLAFQTFLTIQRKITSVYQTLISSYKCGFQTVVDTLEWYIKGCWQLCDPNLRWLHGSLHPKQTWIYSKQNIAPFTTIHWSWAEFTAKLSSARLSRPAPLCWLGWKQCPLITSHESDWFGDARAHISFTTR